MQADIVYARQYQKSASASYENALYFTSTDDIYHAVRWQHEARKEYDAFWLFMQDVLHIPRNERG